MSIALNEAKLYDKYNKLSSIELCYKYINDKNLRKSKKKLIQNYNFKIKIIR